MFKYGFTKEQNQWRSDCGATAPGQQGLEGGTFSGQKKIFL